MTESLPAVLFRRERVGNPVPVDPYADLTALDNLLQTMSPDYPGLSALKRRRDDLVAALYGQLPELDLHLDGANVKDHSTDAAALAKFIGAAAQAAKEMTKSIQGLKRLVSHLLVTPGPGSVRLTFAPPVPEVPPGATSPQPLPRVETAGLRRLVSLLKVAELTDDPAGAEVAAALQDLSVPARRAVRSFAMAALTGDYEVSGVWRDPRHGDIPVKLSHAAAARLKEASSSEVRDITTTRLEGTIDGWEWSSSTVKFIPRVGRPFRATVPDSLGDLVARLGGQRDLPVRAAFTVVTTYAQGTDRPTGTGYALDMIAQLVEAADLWTGSDPSEQPNDME